MSVGITIEGGIQFGAGVLVGVDSVFTISPSDFTSGGGATGVSPFGTNGTDGFILAASSNFNNIVNYVYYMNSPQGGVSTRLASAFTAAGMDPGYAYAWNATWSAGSTTINNIVRLSWNGSTLDMTVIDTSDTAWQSGSVSGPSLYGTYNFPATFSPYSPLTQLSSSGNWC